jgi:sugar phosphate isomerase/epimerase
VKYSWNGYVDIGLIHSMAFPATGTGAGPYIESLRTIANDSFFSAVEIRRPADVEIRKKAVEITETSGIRVILAGQPTLLAGKLNLNSEVQQDREAALADVKKTIDDAVFFKAEKVIVLSGAKPAPEKKKKELELLVDSLKELSLYAKANNIIISLEAFDENIDKKCLIGVSTEAVKVADEVRKTCSNFGLTVDLSHLPLLKEKADYTLNTVKSVVNHIHAGNCYLMDKQNPAYGDQHPRFGYQGGENNIKELASFIRVLFKYDYLKNTATEKPPIISFEVKPVGGEDPVSVIANTKRVWQKAWALL